MGGLPRAKLHDNCACCQDPITRDPTSYDACLPLLTLRRIGLCQPCLEGDCWCENLDDMSDQLMELEVEYEDKISDLKGRIEKLEEARLRGVQFLRKNTKR